MSRFGRDNWQAVTVTYKEKIVTAGNHHVESRSQHWRVLLLLSGYFASIPSLTYESPNRGRAIYNRRKKPIARHYFWATLQLARMRYIAQNPRYAIIAEDSCHAR